METLDWTKLSGDITPEPGKIPYAPNKHLFKKVAFDVFQLNSSPVESLWTLEDGDNGEQFLVAQYSDEQPETLEVKSHWAALADKEGKNVTLTYKNSPIQRFASSDFGFGEEDVHTFQQALVEKLGSDKSFVSKLLKSQPKSKLNLLVSQFPELLALAVEQNFPEFTIEDPGAQTGPTPEELEYEADRKTDTEDIKVEAMHLAARAIREVDKFDKFTKEDIEEILNSLYEELAQ